MTLWMAFPCLVVVRFRLGYNGCIHRILPLAYCATCCSSTDSNTLVALTENNSLSLVTGCTSLSLSADTWYGLCGIAVCSLASSGTFRHIGARLGTSRSCSFSKANKRDNVSGATCNFPGLCHTLKSKDCMAIAHLVSMFKVSCIV